MSCRRPTTRPFASAFKSSVSKRATKADKPFLASRPSWITIIKSTRPKANSRTAIQCRQSEPPHLTFPPALRTSSIPSREDAPQATPCAESLSFRLSLSTHTTCATTGCRMTARVARVAPKAKKGPTSAGRPVGRRTVSKGRVTAVGFLRVKLLHPSPVPLEFYARRDFSLRSQ